MTRTIEHIGRPLHATINVPGSKSITNRALICAALANGVSTIHNASDSDDTILLANGLNQFGVLVRKEVNDLIVHGTGGNLYAPKLPIPVGNAGTTLRFLLSLAALAHGTTTLVSDPGMNRRPIAEILDALAQLGIRATADGHSRYVVDGGGLQGGKVTVSGSRSSQFLSSLMLVSPYASGEVVLSTEEVVSRPYVEMTRAVMSAFGVRQNARSPGTKQQYSPTQFTVEGDASAASYFFAAAAICGGEILVLGLTPQSLQGDIKFVEILQRMGCQASAEPEGILIVKDLNTHLQSVDENMSDKPDIVPSLAMIALFAKGTTVLRNVAHLAYKETDRIQALRVGIAALGGSVGVHGDDLSIEASTLHGARIDTYEDHRTAMSFAIAGLMVNGVTIENPQCVRKSFPSFWDEFQKLYVN